MKIPQTLKRIFAVAALAVAACTQDPPAPPTNSATDYDEAPRINSRTGPGLEVTVEYNFGGSAEVLACDPACASGGNGGGRE